MFEVDVGGRSASDADVDGRMNRPHVAHQRRVAALSGACTGATARRELSGPAGCAGATAETPGDLVTCLASARTCGEPAGGQ